MIYDDVPDVLLRSGLLMEIMIPERWKVLPNDGNVVRLGFFRMLQMQREYSRWKENLRRRQEEERARQEREAEASCGRQKREYDNLRMWLGEIERGSASEVHTGLPNQ